MLSLWDARISSPVKKQKKHSQSLLKYYDYSCPLKLFISTLFHMEQSQMLEKYSHRMPPMRGFPYMYYFNKKKKEKDFV